MFSLLRDELESVPAWPIHKVPGLISSPLQVMESAGLDGLPVARHKSLINVEEMWTTTIKDIYCVVLRGKLQRKPLNTSHEETLPPCVCITNSDAKKQSGNDGFTLNTAVNHKGRSGIFPGLTQLKVSQSQPLERFLLVTSPLVSSFNTSDESL